MISDEEENAGGEEEKKRQKRGGKGMLKSKKKEDVPKLVQVSRAPRGKKKSVTVVSGLSTFGMFHLRWPSSGDFIQNEFIGSNWMFVFF